MSNNNSSIGPLLFLSGVVVGAVAAVLLTPKSGSEVREKLKNNAGRMSDELHDTAEDLKSQATKATENATTRLKRATKNVAKSE